MSNSEKGKLVKLLPEQSGQGSRGEWKKREFVIETTGQYPKKICFEAWGDKVAQLDFIKTGQEIEVFFNLESREYNEKWYTGVKAWKIKGEGIAEVATSSGADSEDDLPF